MSKNSKRIDRQFVINYTLLCKLVGVLGLALPIIIPLGTAVLFQVGIQSSLSAYYYTGMRDVFVGILWAIGVFLFSYKGYENKDDIASSIAGLFAILVAIFPTDPQNATDSEKMIGTIHASFAAIFLGTLTYMAWSLFTKTHENQVVQPGTRKALRNLIYQICAGLMAVSVVGCGLYLMLPKSMTSSLAAFYPLLILESLAVIAFSIAWLIKGDTLFQD